MAAVYDFTADNLSSPDQYTVRRDCKTIRIVEKDRTADSLAPFNIYPAGSSGYISYLGGETCTLNGWNYFTAGTKPFSMETVGVASAVFSVIEE